MLVLKGLEVFIEPFNFSFFSVPGWGIDLDYRDIEWFALETKRDHSVIFEIASKYCISDSFVDYDGYSISSKGFLPTTELNSPIPVHFSSLIPRMSMFTLAISCLATSNLLWFMDLTFQVPMHYCSLQHRTLLPSPVTSTLGVVFAFFVFFHFNHLLIISFIDISFWKQLGVLSKIQLLKTN